MKTVRKNPPEAKETVPSGPSVEQIFALLENVKAQRNAALDANAQLGAINSDLMQKLQAANASIADLQEQFKKKG